LRTVAWGIGCGIGIVVATAVYFHYRDKPKGWDKNVLKVKHVKAEGEDKLDDKFKPTSVGVIISADLENTSDHDIILPKETRIMQENKEGGSLHGSLLTVSKDYFLPAGHTVNIWVENDDLCTGTEKEEDCFNSYFKGQSKVVLFKDTDKIEVEIPIPGFSRPVPTGGAPVQLP
jgi:hypothetical protein